MRLYGTNSRAAPFAGIPTFRVLVLTYALSGITAACAGLVILSRANSANADYGTSYLLLSVLINILAGVNPNGGSGTIFGLVLAVLSLQFLSSGLNLIAVDNIARDLLDGALLVTVMIPISCRGVFDRRGCERRFFHDSTLLDVILIHDGIDLERRVDI